MLYDAIKSPPDCVVTVQLAFRSYDTRFRTTLDRELFVRQSWSDDRERCRHAGIPDDVVYRPQYTIALELLDRAHEVAVLHGHAWQEA